MRNPRTGKLIAWSRAAILACVTASPNIWAQEDLPDYITIDCFRGTPSMHDININRAICDAEATNPVGAKRRRYKHGVYRPVNERDYDDYPQMKEDNRKCPPGSKIYICLGVDPVR